ncbi:MAG: carboxypeptidase-like regulatory domain-containing protein [Vicinamibacterales bacterium]
MRSLLLGIGALYVIAVGMGVAGQQAPARDVTTAAPPRATGSGTISGIVLSAQAPLQPIARATVTLSGQGPVRTTLSDQDGHFSFDELTAGRYTLAAVRPGYVKMTFGALGPDRAGTPLAISAGEHLDALTITLPRGAVIAGLVTNEMGRPAQGISVRLMRFQQRNGARTLVSPAPVGGGIISMQTDDLGSYRLFGLPAGDYVVSATPQEVASLSGTRGSLPASAPAAIYVPVYFPGTTVASAASVITVVGGEERMGVGIPLSRVKAAALSGVVMNPLGSPRGAVVSLDSRSPAWSGPSGLGSDVTVGDDGRFSFSGLAPGDYTVKAVMPLIAPAVGRPASELAIPSAWGRTEVAISGTDIRDLSLLLQPALTFSGKIAFDGPDVPADIAGRLRIALKPEPSPGLNATRSADIQSGGTFRIVGVVPGEYRIVSAMAPSDASGWALASATANGRDAVDLPFDIGPSENIADALITFTRATQQVSGVLQSELRVPSSDYTLLIFPTDRAYWRDGSRRTQTTRPGTDGRFVVRGLPPGDYFLAALTDLEPDAAGDPSVLELIAPVAIRFRLAPGESKIQDLKVTTP